jgi:hypothetical protein
MHFASRLGLDQSSVRGIPATREDGRASLLAENAWLRARVAELELALKASATAPRSASASASATPVAEKMKSVPDNRNAKLKDEPWLALGLSRRTYFRRKAAGKIEET